MLFAPKNADIVKKIIQKYIINYDNLFGQEREVQAGTTAFGQLHHLTHAWHFFFEDCDKWRSSDPNESSSSNRQFFFSPEIQQVFISWFYQASELHYFTLEQNSQVFFLRVRWAHSRAEQRGKTLLKKLLCDLTDVKKRAASIFPPLACQRHVKVKFWVRCRLLYRKKIKALLVAMLSFLWTRDVCSMCSRNDARSIFHFPWCSTRKVKEYFAKIKCATNDLPKLRKQIGKDKRLLKLWYQILQPVLVCMLEQMCTQIITVSTCINGSFLANYWMLVICYVLFKLVWKNPLCLGYQKNRLLFFCLIYSPDRWTYLWIILNGRFTLSMNVTVSQNFFPTNS